MNFNTSENDQTEIDWVTAEAGRSSMRTELMRLKRRAKKHIFLLLFICLLGVSAIIGKMSRGIPIYEGTILLRATEGVLLEQDTPVVRRELAHYLFTVALNTEKLRPIVEEFDLYPERETFGQLYAINKLRDFLTIDIKGNYFAKNRGDGDQRRTVGISISFSDFDPQKAFVVAKKLAEVLVESEYTRRHEDAEQINDIANYTVGHIKNQLAQQEKELVDTVIIINGPRQTKEQNAQIVEAKIRKKRIVAAIIRNNFLLDTAISNQSHTKLATQAQHADQALRIEIIDSSRPIIVPKRSKIVYVIVGLFVFLLMLPVVAIGVGALDTRLHHIEDLVRLGIPVVGHMPSFPSDRVGSMKERIRHAKNIT